MAEEAEEAAALPPLGVPTLELPHGGVPALGVPPLAGAGGGGAAAGGGGGAGGGSQMSVAMSEKLADHGVLVPVVPPGAVPGSPGPDTTIPTPAINAAAAMRMPGRRYHGEAASVSSAVRVAPGVASNAFIAHPPGPKAPKTGVSGVHELPADKSRHWSNRGAGSPVSWHRFLRVVGGPIAGVSTCRKCAPQIQPGIE